MIAYGIKHGELFRNIFVSTVAVSMCFGRDPEPIHKLELVENENGPYWSWEKAGKPGEFSMVYDNKILLNICFPCGVDHMVERGEGRIVRLAINDLGVVNDSE